MKKLAQLFFYITLISSAISFNGHALPKWQNTRIHPTEVRLSTITVRNSISFFSINNCVQCLATCFANLDFRSAYHSKIIRTKERFLKCFVGNTDQRLNPNQLNHYRYSSEEDLPRVNS
jgi:hypothetical protein